MNLAKLSQAKIKFAGKLNAKYLIEDDIISLVNKKTKIIAFVAISNYLGNELDIKKIVKAARKVNPKVIIIVDATQAAPHKKIDVKDCDVDFLFCSGYKMMAATGTGCLYMKQPYLKLIEPLKYGGAMNTAFDTNGFTFAKTYQKFEGGTPHTAGIIS